MPSIYLEEISEDEVNIMTIHLFSIKLSRKYGSNENAKFPLII